MILCIHPLPFTIPSYMCVFHHYPSCVSVTITPQHVCVCVCVCACVRACVGERVCESAYVRQRWPNNLNIGLLIKKVQGSMLISCYRSLNKKLYSHCSCPPSCINETGIDKGSKYQTGHVSLS